MSSNGNDTSLQKKPIMFSQKLIFPDLFANCSLC